ncbi:MAG TPA: glycosyltransferase [Dyella sp.]
MQEPMAATRGQRKKPRVFVLASTYPRWPGDHEPSFVHELCRRLLDRFDVTVVTSHVQDAAREETMDGVDVLRYRYAPESWQTLVYGGGIAVNLRRSPWKYLLVPGFILMQYLAARTAIRRRGADVVHAHWLIPQGTVAACLGRRLRIPFVVTSHGGDLFGLRGRALTAMKRDVAERAAGVTVVSQAMSDELAHIGVSTVAVDVIPMGVDLKTRFAADARIARSADELLFVGRLVAKKGLPNLLGALALLVRDRPACRLTIAGFGPEEQALRRQVERLGLADRVTFLGPVQQQDLPALYRRAALLAAPFVRDASGNQEGLPVVLMEAIACGCPVVVGQVAGLADLLGPEPTRYCVDPTDAQKLAAAIAHVLDHPDEASAWVERKRQYALSQFDWDVIASRYGDVLERALSTR